MMKKELSARLPFFSPVRAKYDERARRKEQEKERERERERESERKKMRMRMRMRTSIRSFRRLDKSVSVTDTISFMLHFLPSLSEMDLRWSLMQTRTSTFSLSLSLSLSLTRSLSHSFSRALHGKYFTPKNSSTDPLLQCFLDSPRDLKRLSSQEKCKKYQNLTLLTGSLWSCSLKRERARPETNFLF